MSAGRLNLVLLVGEPCARLEVDLIPFGLACARAGGATDAVSMLQKTPYAFVVVAAALPDMSGPAFIDGLLRHFDPAAAVLLGEVDSAQAQVLLRSPKVAIFPGGVPGEAVASHLFQRVSGNGATPPPTVQQLMQGSSSTPPQPPRQPTPSPPLFQPLNAAPGRGLFDLPRANAPSFPRALTPQATTWPPTPAESPRSPQPFFAAPPSTPPPDRGLIEKLEAIAAELGRSNTEVALLQNRLARLEAENAALHVEVDAARRNAIHDVAEVMALSDEGEPVSLEVDELKSRVEFAEGERDNASAQLLMVRAERDRLTQELLGGRQQEQQQRQELEGLRRRLLEAHADIEQWKAGVDSADSVQKAALAEADVLRELLTSQRQELFFAAQLEQEARVAAAVADERVRGSQTLAAAAASLAAEQEHSENELNTLRANCEAQRATAVAAAQSRSDGLLGAIKAELDALSAEKGEVEAAWSVDQGRIALLEAQLIEEQAARSDETNAMRVDLNEALRQLNEQIEEAALHSARADRAVADGAAVRALQEQLAADMERWRAKEAERVTRAVDEDVRAKTREILALANALAPFAWGLQRASTFFADKNLEGAADHVRALQLMQMTLERLRNELDRVHTSASAAPEA